MAHSSVRNDPVGCLAEVMPGMFEGSSPIGGAVIGKQLIVTKQIGPETLADSTEYQVPLLIAPCDGVYLKRLYIAAFTKPAGGTNKVNVYRWDGTTDHQQLATADFDPTGLSSNIGKKLTLTTTRSKRLGSAGDVWRVRYEAGAQDTDAVGVIVTAVFIVPSADAD